jgi:hypothetical protein
MDLPASRQESSETVVLTSADLAARDVTEDVQYAYIMNPVRFNLGLPDFSRFGGMGGGAPGGGGGAPGGGAPSAGAPSGYTAAADAASGDAAAGDAATSASSSETAQQPQIPNNPKYPSGCNG